MRTPRSARLGVSALAVAALVASATPVAAQDPSYTPEQMAELEEKVTKMQEFLANQDAFVPTVNLIDTSSLPVTFPYKDIQQHVVVDVAIGDGPALPYMFDTGAPTLVSRELQEANPSELVVEMIGMAGGGGLLITPNRKYPAMTVGDAITVTDVMASDPWEGGDGFHCITPHGLFGASSMQKAVWQVDYGTNQVSVGASIDQLEHIEGAIALPFQINEQNKLSPTPFVTLPVGDGEITFIVDTGGGIPLSIEPAAAAAAGVEIPADGPAFSSLTGGAAGMFEGTTQYARVPITFGDTELSVPVAVAAGMGAGLAAGNIGHSFLKNFVVTFDFPNRMLYLSPLFEGTTVPDLAEPPAVGFGRQDGQVIVTNIPKGGSAEQAGLKVGEVITQIDGQSVEGITNDEYCARFASGEMPEEITTASGATYDAGRIEGFWSSLQ